jgi:RimJ/RimL family protein N-acetyltransferase
MTTESSEAAAQDWELAVDGECLHLRDGTAVQVRRVRPDDGPAVTVFLEHLCRESLELRYFSAVRPDTVAGEILRNSSEVRRVSVLLESVSPTPTQILGHAEYVGSSAAPTQAEVAFLIADDTHGQGAATLLLRQLARHARAAGILTFSAVVLNENKSMRDVFTQAGFPFSILFEREEVLIELDIRQESQTALAVRNDLSPLFPIPDADPTVAAVPEPGDLDRPLRST